MVQLRATRGAIAALFLGSTLIVAAPASAASFAVMHTFTGGADGGNPVSGLSADRAGNLYGTAPNGGSGYGTVFALMRSGSGYVFEVLHAFGSGNDGAGPTARVLPGPEQNLYGTTPSGGGGGGTVYQLSGTAVPRKTSILYSFKNATANGYNPSSGDLAWDPQWNIYGTTLNGGAYSQGTVFELTHLKTGWVEKVLYSFGRPGDGATPVSGVIRDAAGNLYGTTSAGGSAGDGTVYKLSQQGSVWNETILHNFSGQSDGMYPYAGLAFDRAGNLYGAATAGGQPSQDSGGTFFVMTPGSGGWQFQTVYSVPGSWISGEFRTPFVDAAGDIFATTHCDGYGSGSVFELQHTGSTWSLNPFYTFNGSTDGQYAFGGPVFDSFGDLVGTTQVGGSGNGVVWAVKP
jgi:uncharacterized repeat protein (TIGR03803 family)